MSISRKDFIRSLSGFIYLPTSSFLIHGTTGRNETQNNNDNKKNKSKFYIKDQADFDKYKNYTFKEGAMILFAKGRAFKGQFSPIGTGSKNKPIVVCAYNPLSGEIYTDGINDKPVINAMGKFPSAFLLQNASFWEVSNLEITNDSMEAREKEANLRGIDIQAKDAGIIEGIAIRNNYIHDVNTGLAGKKRGGIFVEVKGEKTKTKFHDLRIENNKIQNVGGIGISNSSTWGKPDEENFYPWTNVVIRKNYITHTGRNAIIIRNSISPIVEYNTIAYSSRFDTGNSIFNFNTIGCIMQYNEVYGNTGALTDEDRGAFDADFNSKGTIIQYNYSHDNHWFCSIMRKKNMDVTVRYNISQNDLLGAYFYGFPTTKGLTDLKIYNNTHYFQKGAGTEVFVSAGRERIPIETHLFNNIFYFTDKGRWSNIPDKTCKIENNLFYNFDKKALNEIIADPLFLNPGRGGTGIDIENDNSLKGYCIRENSPAKNAGILIKKNGGRDFWGNPLSSRSIDIGACESQ